MLPSSYLQNGVFQLFVNHSAIMGGLLTDVTVLWVWDWLLMEQVPPFIHPPVFEHPHDDALMVHLQRLCLRRWCFWWLCPPTAKDCSINNKPHKMMPLMIAPPMIDSFTMVAMTIVSLQFGSFLVYMGRMAWLSMVWGFCCIRLAVVLLCLPKMALEDLTA